MTWGATYKKTYVQQAADTDPSWQFTHTMTKHPTNIEKQIQVVNKDKKMYIQSLCTNILSIFCTYTLGLSGFSNIRLKPATIIYYQLIMGNIDIMKQGYKSVQNLTRPKD